MVENGLLKHQFFLLLFKPLRLLSCSRALIILTAGLILSGCETGSTSFPILDEPGIRVEVTSRPPGGSGKRSPLELSPVQMARILKGLRIIERNKIIGFGLLTQKEGAPAFLVEEIYKLAPALARGLKLSSARDVVTFYSVVAGPKGEPLITSGGLFVNDGRLHVLLANCRSRPSDTSNSFDTVTELDHRHAPLLPMGRYQFYVEFDPDSVLVAKDRKENYSWGSYIDSSQVVVLDLVQLFPESVEPAASTN
jgi:hypothetical protein